MAELTITKEKVLEAASKCPTAKETLKILFPEVFEENKYFDLNRLKISQDGTRRLFTEESCRNAGFSGISPIEIRIAYEYSGKGFYLDNTFKWEIVIDESDNPVLLPTRRQ